MINLINLDNFLNYISLGAWIVFIIYVIAVFVRSWMHEGVELALHSLATCRVLVPLALTIVVTLAAASFVFVDPTRVGVVVSTLSSNGIRPQPIDSGVHFIVPLLEQDVQYPVSWQTYTMSSTPNEGERPGDDSIRARTSDGQEVRLDCSIIFRVNQEQVVSLHIDWQFRYPEEYIRPLIRGVVRTQVSQFTAREMNSSARKDLEASLSRILTEQLATNGLLVDRFLLRDITFTDEFAMSVENKQIALEGRDQATFEADAMRNLAEGQRDKMAIEAQGRSQQYMIEAEGKAKAIVVEAQAQAEALQMIGASLAGNPNLLTYQYIEKLSPSIKTMLVPNNAPLILPLPDMTADVTSSSALTATTPMTKTAPMTTTINALPDVLPKLPTDTPTDQQ